MAKIIPIPPPSAVLLEPALKDQSLMAKDWYDFFKNFFDNDPRLPRAWTSFDGTQTPPVHWEQYGFASAIVRNDVGNYTLTFAVPMRTTTYMVMGQVQENLTNTQKQYPPEILDRTTTQLTIQTHFDSGDVGDFALIRLLVFGGL